MNKRFLKFQNEINFFHHWWLTLKSDWAIKEYKFYFFLEYWIWVSIQGVFWVLKIFLIFEGSPAPNFEPFPTETFDILDFLTTPPPPLPYLHPSKVSLLFSL